MKKEKVLAAQKPRKGRWHQKNTDITRPISIETVENKFPELFKLYPNLKPQAVYDFADTIEHLSQNGFELPPLLDAFLKIYKKPEDLRVRYKSEIATEAIRDEKKTYVDPNPAFTIEKEREADSHVNITIEVKKEDMIEVKHVFTGTAANDRGDFDWKPDKETLYEHTEDFYRWINAINTGFQNIIEYKPFNLYVQESQGWLHERKDMNSFRTREELKGYIREERRRCVRNSLYYLDKYHYFKDAESRTGFTKYTARKGQQVLCFLVDCGYSMFIGKARQVYFTTTLFGIGLKNIMMRKSFYLKIISADDKKAKRTFEDKFKSPYYQVSQMLRPAKRYTDQQGQMGFHMDKKTMEGGGSIATVETATEDAVNSGEPAMIYIDEMGLIDIIVLMIENAKSTLWKPNEHGKMVRKNQLLAFGTSDTVNTPGFKTLMNAARDNWDARNFRYGFVPVMFNCFARDGVDQEFYDQQKLDAYSVTGPESEKVRVKFHQDYPVVWDDMFLDSAQTIIPLNRILVNINRSEQTQKGIMRGYFDPIINESVKVNGRPKIIGSTWIPATSVNDPLGIWELYEQPAHILDRKQRWRYRYYQGTDPIMSATGQSDFASVIWDAVADAPVGLLSFRPVDHRFAFHQAALGGLYFDVEKELAESNIGQNYIDFLIDLGLNQRLEFNSALPRHYQTEGNPYGIRKTTQTQRYMVGDLILLLDNNEDKINYVRFWSQLRRYVLKEGRQTNYDVYAPSNKNFDRDDVIDAVLYAKIQANNFSNHAPRDLNEVRNTPSKRAKLYMTADWRLQRVPARKERTELFRG